MQQHTPQPMSISKAADEFAAARHALSGTTDASAHPSASLPSQPGAYAAAAAATPSALHSQSDAPPGLQYVRERIDVAGADADPADARLLDDAAVEALGPDCVPLFECDIGPHAWTLPPQKRNTGGPDLYCAPHLKVHRHLGIYESIKECERAMRLPPAVVSRRSTPAGSIDGLAGGDLSEHASNEAPGERALEPELSQHAIDGSVAGPSTSPSASDIGFSDSRDMSAEDAFEPAAQGPTSGAHDGRDHAADARGDVAARALADSDEWERLRHPYDWAHAIRDIATRDRDRPGTFSVVLDLAGCNGARLRMLSPEAVAPLDFILRFGHNEAELRAVRAVGQQRDELDARQAARATTEGPSMQPFAHGPARNAASVTTSTAAPANAPNASVSARARRNSEGATTDEEYAILRERFLRLMSRIRKYFDPMECSRCRRCFAAGESVLVPPCKHVLHAACLSERAKCRFGQQKSSMTCDICASNLQGATLSVVQREFQLRRIPGQK